MDLFVIAAGLALLPFLAAAGIAMTAGRRFFASRRSKPQTVKAESVPVFEPADPEKVRQT